MAVFSGQTIDFLMSRRIPHKKYKIHFRKMSSLQARGLRGAWQALDAHVVAWSKVVHQALWVPPVQLLIAIW